MFSVVCVDLGRRSIYNSEYCEKTGAIKKKV